MIKQDSTSITVHTKVKASLENVWRAWTAPEHITQWCHASDDWHAPHAENDLQKGGKFKTVMASKDGAASFDFEGIYDLVKEPTAIDYTMADGRKVTIRFFAANGMTDVEETFDAETTHPVSVQRESWQAILNNFKTYTEATFGK